MLGKVIKYDMKYLNRLLVPYYLILIGMAGLIRLLGIIGEHNEAIKVTSTIIKVFFFVGVALVLVYTLVIVLKRFYDNTYKEEGYLTHTLPIKRGNVIDSKIILSVFYVIVGIGVMALTLLIAVYSTELVETIKNILAEINLGFNISMAKLIIYMVLIVFSSYFSYLLMIMAGMSIGQTFNDKRTLWSVVFSVLIYYVSQIISTVVMLVFSFGKMNMLDIIKTGKEPVEFVTFTMGLSFALTAVLLVAYYIIAKITLTKKLNIL